MSVTSDKLEKPGNVSAAMDVALGKLHGLDWSNSFLPSLLKVNKRAIARTSAITISIGAF
ncbi:hypothetical protein RMSM_02905 [Rhodopirellula maiorica SM1]|uniref:Uncharacterized protein n=1 Tax=Rhodopirellula maiorica SM1 TaxID=1265738 RepID=M5RLI4_9BACT|nr:hypothetical protein [Rhodopirellula maiorica]EMI20175.1 hypothetical protein RMSM_02905 [Rhodopirellula maiorica SM1]